MRTLAIDLGERRVGLAVSDPDGSMAFPLRVAHVHSVEEALSAVQAACQETEAERVVVGLPVNMNGTEGPMAAQARAFAQKVAERSGLPVDTWDERLSTAQVEKELIRVDLSRSKRKQIRDKLAAQVILQGYLDRQALP